MSVRCTAAGCRGTSQGDGWYCNRCGSALPKPEPPHIFMSDGDEAGRLRFLTHPKVGAFNDVSELREKLIGKAGQHPDRGGFYCEHGGWTEICPACHYRTDRGGGGTFCMWCGAGLECAPYPKGPGMIIVKLQAPKVFCDLRRFISGLPMGRN